jgi:hypothetical protein
VVAVYQANASGLDPHRASMTRRFGQAYITSSRRVGTRQDAPDRLARGVRCRRAPDARRTAPPSPAANASHLVVWM